MLRTTDSGATWQTANTGLPAVNASPVCGCAGRPGPGTMDRTGLAHTTDERATWQAQSTGTTTLSGPPCVDSLTAGARRRWGTPPDGQWRPELAGNGARPNRRQFNSSIAVTAGRSAVNAWLVPSLFGWLTWQARALTAGTPGVFGRGHPFWDNVVPGRAVFYLDAHLRLGCRQMVEWPDPNWVFSWGLRAAAHDRRWRDLDRPLGSRRLSVATPH